MDESNLAINGGAKAIEGYEGAGPPKISNEEFLEMASVWGYSQGIIDKIKEAIEKDDLGGGPSLVAYTPASRMHQLAEKAVELLDVKYVIPVTSGTAALHCAYIAADICQGDEVISPDLRLWPQQWRQRERCLQWQRSSRAPKNPVCQ